METPYFNYYQFRDDFLNVYEPAEDSFLLLDALQNDIDLIKNLNLSICMEIGSGSGIIITSLAKLLKYGFFLATDINPHACKTTLKCAQNNGANGQIEVINTDLSSGLEKLENKVDILVFNPPYVPTNDTDITKNCLLDRSFAGGRNGRIVIDQFLDRCLSLLTKNGLLYLLLIKENKPQEIIEKLNLNNFEAKIVLTRKAKNETQFIVKAKQMN